MQIYAQRVHGEIISFDEGEGDLHEQQFFQVVNLIEEYLEPVVEEIKFVYNQLRTMGAAEVLSVKSDPQNNNVPCTLVLLADQHLLEFPLEALSWFRRDESFGSLSRDISMNMFCKRFPTQPSANIVDTDPDVKKGKKAAPKAKPPKKDKGSQMETSGVLGQEIKVEAGSFKYLIDPHRDSFHSELRPIETFELFRKENAKSYASQWKGYAGSDALLSTQELESLALRDGSGMFLIFELFSDVLSLCQTAVSDLSKCPVMLLVDKCQSALSYNRMLKYVDEKNRLTSPMDSPLTVALMLSLAGVSCIVQNQWYSSPTENFIRFGHLLEDMFVKNYLTGEAVLLTMNKRLRFKRELRAENERTSESAKGENFRKEKKPKSGGKLSDKKVFEKKEKTEMKAESNKEISLSYFDKFAKKDLALNKSDLNLVCYGLPNILILKQ